MRKKFLVKESRKIKFGGLKKPSRVLMSTSLIVPFCQLFKIDMGKFTLDTFVEGLLVLQII